MTVGLICTGPVEPRLRAGVSEALTALEVPNAIASLTISLSHLDDRGAQAKAQAACDASGAHHLPILWTAASLTIGPVLPASGKGCAQCIRLWQAPATDFVRPEAGGVKQQRVQAETGAVCIAPVFRSMALHVADLVAAGAADTGDDQRYAVVITALPFTVKAHGFLAHPHCARCSPVRPAVAPIVPLDGLTPYEGLRRPNPAITLDSLRHRYLDERTGLINRWGQVDAGIYPLFGASFTSDRISGDRQSGFGRTGARRADERVAILEALERFAGTQKLGGVPALVAAFGADPRMVDPKRFILHDSSQESEAGFALAPYDPDTSIAWTPARNLTTGREVLVPEQLVYYGMAATHERSTGRSIYEISNGCSLGSSFEDAALHGLFEVCERDAFLCHWYTGKTPVEIDLDTVPDVELPLIRARIEGDGYLLRAFDISTLRSVRAMMVALIDPRSDTPFATVCAGGAHSDPLLAFKGALVEAASTFTSTHRPAFGEARETALAMLKDPARVQSMDDHLLLYSAPEAKPRLDFLIKDRAAAPFDARRATAPHGVREVLAGAVRELAEAGHEVLVADQSFDLLAPSGLKAVKVLVPGLLPMTFGHQYRRICHRRLAAFFSGDGYVFNAHPHNFP